jgi:hypothetical protein
MVVSIKLFKGNVRRKLGFWRLPCGPRRVVRQQPANSQFAISVTPARSSIV